MRSTFAGFTTAQLALRASQQALNVTGQNISNINTTGYTRQALDQISLNFKGHNNGSNAKIGYGVYVTGVSQLRDPFLDIRFRKEISQVGDADETLSTLNELKSTFDEVSKTGLHNQMLEISSMLQKLSTNIGNKEFDNMAKSSSDALCKLMNQYAKQTNDVRENQETNLKNVDIPEVNDLLKNISQLNKTIQNGQVNGNAALELMDQRNMLIDELATYMKIDVQYEDVKLSNDTTVQKLKINFVGDTNSYNLIDHDYSGSLNVEKNATTGKMEIYTSDKTTGTRIDLNDEFSTGSLHGSLDMLNSSGSFESTANAPKGIGYYEKMLDLMANKFADVFNKINNQGSFDDTTGVLVGGEPLFGTMDGSATVTAGNICIADGWAKREYGINASTKFTDVVGGDDNILNMINGLTLEHSFESGGKNMFTGSFSNYFSNVGSTLGLEIKTTKSTLTNHTAIVKELSNSRDGISGVSLDEEGMNLLQYQKSYTAAARLMTTLDEAMETLLAMGKVGR